jgi:8-oxo-dGTP pyrophosphatase MutT (NUDIX family)
MSNFKYIKRLKNNNMYCSNCGKYGHRYKKCYNPTISLGIVCFKYDNHKIKNIHKSNLHNELYNLMDDQEINTIKYLIVQRKHSLGYMEFIRGKYTLKNINYILRIFGEMTPIERNNINTQTFDELWNNLWLIDNKPNLHKNEYFDSKCKFDILYNGINANYNGTDIDLTINYCIFNTISKYDNPEWGFPKGRRNIQETDINCAQREFLEETNFIKSDYNIVNTSPISEIFKGSNHIRYKHTYYIAQSINDNNPFIDINNKFQQMEIGDLGWFTYDEIMSKFRDNDVEKKKVLTKINMFVQKIIYDETIF